MDQHTMVEQAYKNGYAKGYAEGKPKWIPVTERLPNEEDADEAGCVLAIERMDGFARRWEIGGIRTYPDLYTHWMPTPEPPKEVNNG